ncbi:MAG: PilZ domain-containing protein, partial [Acidobacteria bacterium]|nr:PilZ domain-containing protein [Acidobacteriota bacterium]
MSEERRREERVPLMLELRWESLSGKHTARISDMSLSGCYVETMAQVTVGELIRFEVQLPTGRLLPLIGEAVYHLPGMGFGLRFRSLTERQREVILSLLEYM